MSKRTTTEYQNPDATSGCKNEHGLNDGGLTYIFLSSSGKHIHQKLLHQETQRRHLCSSSIFVVKLLFESKHKPLLFEWNSKYPILLYEWFKLSLCYCDFCLPMVAVLLQFKGVLFFNIYCKNIVLILYSLPLPLGKGSLAQYQGLVALYTSSSDIYVQELNSLKNKTRTKILSGMCFKSSCHQT